MRRLRGDDDNDDGKFVLLYSISSLTHTEGTAQAAELLISCSAKGEAALHDSRTSPVCLFYAITTVFQLYNGCDMMRKRMPQSILSLTQGIFNLPHHIGRV